MSVLLIPMTQSATFKKFGVGPSAVEEKKESKKKQEQEMIQEMVSSKFKETGMGSQIKKRKDLEKKESKDTEMQAQDEDQERGDEGGNGAAGCEGPAAKKAKTQAKKAVKSKFSGFSAAEKEQYSETVSSPTDEKEFRCKTALDEILGALSFTADIIRQESLARWQAAKLSQKEIKKSQEEEEKALLSTTRFCLSIFLEFVFTQQVALNGTQYRFYTGLRSELQGVLQAAHSTWSTSMANTGAGGEEISQQKDALSLAQLLCDTYANKPVTSIGWDDEIEEADKPAKNVTSIMTLNYSQIVQPLILFLKRNLKLPVLLHEFPRAFLMKLRTQPSMELIDLLSFMKDEINEHLPFVWTAFAADVSDCYGSKKRFVEKTEQAGIGLGLVAFSD